MSTILIEKLSFALLILSKTLKDSMKNLLWKFLDYMKTFPASWLWYCSSYRVHVVLFFFLKRMTRRLISAFRQRHRLICYHGCSKITYFHKKFGHRKNFLEMAATFWHYRLFSDASSPSFCFDHRGLNILHRDSIWFFTCPCSQVRSSADPHFV